MDRKIELTKEKLEKEKNALSELEEKQREFREKYVEHEHKVDTAKKELDEHLASRNFVEESKHFKSKLTKLDEVRFSYFFFLSISKLFCLIFFRKFKNMLLKLRLPLNVKLKHSSSMKKAKKLLKNREKLLFQNVLKSSRFVP